MRQGRPRVKTLSHTKGELFATYAYQTARTLIQKAAHKLYKESGKPMVCFFCGYKNHVDLAHRRAVKDFPSEALLSEINHLDNLIILCPNHHREADSGMIDLLEAKNISSKFGEMGFVPVPHLRKRRTHPKGSVVLRSRKGGLNVWVYIYREGGTQKTLRMGDLNKYPTKEDVWEAIESVKRAMKKEFSSTF